MLKLFKIYRKKLKYIKIYWKSQNISFFLINFNIFDLSFDNFGLLINNFQSNFDQKIENRLQPIVLIENRSKLYWNRDHRLELVVEFWIGQKSMIKFWIQIRMDDDKSIWDGKLSKLSAQHSVTSYYLKSFKWWVREGSPQNYQLGKATSKMTSKEGGPPLSKVK